MMVMLEFCLAKSRNAMPSEPESGPTITLTPS